MIANADIFYNELRKTSNEFRNDLSDDLIKRLSDDCNLLISVARAAREKGLLEIHNGIAGSFPDAELKDSLSNMISMVEDGMDPMLIEDYCLKEYFAKGYTGLKGFRYLVYLDSILQIQEGVSASCLVNSLKACMPDGVSCGIV